MCDSLPLPALLPAAKLRSVRGALLWALFVACLGLLLTSALLFAESGKELRKDYALIFGTVFSADGHVVRGVRVKIRRADQKKAKWELLSNTMGEFAQRVPTGQADYIVWAEVKTPKGSSRPETKVHIENDERVDISLHLN